MKIGSAAVEAISCGDLGEELPLVQPVLKTLRAINEKVETGRAIRKS